MNYTELVEAIQNNLEYSEADFVADIPNFVARAEERILRDVSVPAFIQTDTTSVTDGNKFLATPTGFLYPEYLSVNGRMLINKERDFLSEAYPAGTAEGAPIYYAIFDEDSLVMAPTPDSAYSAEISYSRSPESIVTATNTWIGDNASRALLYACLVEAAIYMRQDEDVIAALEMSYQDAKAQLSTFGALRAKKDSFKERDMRPNDA